MLRRFVRHPRTQAVLAWLLGGYLAFVHRTTRWTLLGEEHFRAATAADDQRGIIFAFWHEGLAMTPMALRHARAVTGTTGLCTHVLVSRHRDGRFIGEVVKRFDLRMVYASSSKGGATGLRELMRILSSGGAIGITPDGPRGPRRQAKPGVVQLAALSGATVLPSAARTSRVKVLRSWDRMMIPLPFARGVAVVGAPVAVPREAARADAALADIEVAMTAACDRAAAWLDNQA